MTWPSPLFDRYRLLQRECASPVGESWRGIDEQSGRLVRVRVAHAATAEARWPEAAIDRQPPGVYPIHDLVRRRGHVVAVVQPELPAQPLRQRFPTAIDEDRHIAHLVRDVALILAGMHECGATHGDVSLDTIHLTDEDEVLLADAGIGLRTAASDAYETARDRFDPAAPERRERKFKLDERADLYALGCVMFELMTGQPATDTPAAIASDPHGPVDDVPPIETIAAESATELRAICSQLLHTDPVHRYLHASTLIRDIDAYLHGKRSKPYVKLAFMVIAAATVALFGLWGSVGGGPARVIDVQVRVQRAVHAAPDEAALDATAPALSMADRFQIHARLSRDGELTAFYRTPAGRVLDLGDGIATPDDGAYVLPSGDPDGWLQPPASGPGLLLLVTHAPSAIDTTIVEAALLSLGDPPRGLSAVAWYGRHLPRQPEPALLRADSMRWSSFDDYARQVIRLLDPHTDDCVVALTYFVGT